MKSRERTGSAIVHDTPVPARESEDCWGSDPIAATLRELLSPCGLNIQVVDGGAGAASAMKLLRAVFMKGITALLLDALGSSTRMTRAGE